MMIVTVNFVMAMMMTTTTTSKAKEKNVRQETLVLQWVLTRAHFNLMLTPSLHKEVGLPGTGGAGIADPKPK